MLLSGLFSTGFTTKPGHCGLGLGLPQARAFAEREGGAISVQTKERAGTTFHLWLPRANFTEAEPAAAVAAARRRHVLLVGLPEGVAGPIAEALRRHGLNAIVAGDDAEARLADPDVVFHATLVCAARDDPEPGRLIQFIRRHRLALKVILQPAGCTEEDLDPQLLTKADLVLAESVTTEQVAERLARELSP